MMVGATLLDLTPCALTLGLHLCLKKSQPDKGWDFESWFWGGTPRQTTIESTESKRCGLLRTIANSIEKPAGL
jgi:hypothetical protein